jgi:uncharacterized membrane protein YfcA
MVNRVPFISPKRSAVSNGQAYFILTGLLLIAAAVLMVVKRAADAAEERHVHFLPAVAVGAGSRLRLRVNRSWRRCVPDRCANCFWLGVTQAGCGSLAALHSLQLRGRADRLRLAGQTLAPGTLLYSVGALAVAGTAIGRRWMSERTTRYVLAVILLFAGLRLSLR